jgi:hypothetical protein
MFSDNGMNFIGASRELKQAIRALDQQREHYTLATKGIDCHFSPPRAPHFGGIWEILVCKTCIEGSTQNSVRP